MNAVAKAVAKALFPPAVDNTMVGGFRACETKFWWRHQQHLQRGEVSIHLTSGAAFARGLEVTRKCYFDKGLSFEESLAHGAAALFYAYGHVEPHPKYAGKTATNLVGALKYYFEQWPIDRIIKPYRDANGKHTIEWNFSVPIPNTIHPNTGGPILYCGRFDMVAEHEQFPGLWGEDDKTTSQLGEQWINSWRLPNQILGYCWGAREHGLKLAGFNIRGVSLLKHSYGEAECPLFVNDWQLERFLINLQRTVARMVEAYKKDVWEMDLGKSCSQFGGCDYIQLCEAHDPTPWIEPNYTYNIWNPLASRD